MDKFTVIQIMTVQSLADLANNLDIQFMKQQLETFETDAETNKDELQARQLERAAKLLLKAYSQMIELAETMQKLDALQKKIERETDINLN